jgi:hypothetical protein
LRILLKCLKIRTIADFVDTLLDISFALLDYLRALAIR